MSVSNQVLSEITSLLKFDELNRSGWNLSIGILGLTYKPGTSTLRRSAALEIINDLLSKGAVVFTGETSTDIGSQVLKILGIDN